MYINRNKRKFAFIIDFYYKYVVFWKFNTIKKWPIYY